MTFTIHFTQRSTVAARLVKRGSRPKVASYPGRAKVSFSGFVELGADKGRLFIDSPERRTIASIRGYLATLAPEDKRQIWMILDKTPWHSNVIKLRSQREAKKGNSLIFKGYFYIVALGKKIWMIK